jgi:6-phosphogluconolactonase
LCDGFIPKSSVSWLDCSFEGSQLADFYDQHIKRLSVCVLGMGDDGHIASLFPGSSVLETKPSGGLVHADASEGLEPRITLSPSAIMDAADIHLLIYGSGKKTVLDKAASSDDIMTMPVRLLLNQTQKDIEIHYAD